MAAPQELGTCLGISIPFKTGRQESLFPFSNKTLGQLTLGHPLQLSKFLLTDLFLNYSVTSADPVCTEGEEKLWEIGFLLGFCLFVCLFQDWFCLSLSVDIARAFVQGSK